MSDLNLDRPDTVRYAVQTIRVTTVHSVDKFTVSVHLISPACVEAQTSVDVYDWRGVMER